MTSPHKKAIWNLQSDYIIEKELWKCVWTWWELMVAHTAIAIGDHWSGILIFNTRLSIPFLAEIADQSVFC